MLIVLDHCSLSMWLCVMLVDTDVVVDFAFFYIMDVFLFWIVMISVDILKFWL